VTAQAAPASTPTAPSPAPPRTAAAMAGRRLWPRWRPWLVITLVIAAGSTAITLLHKPPVNTYLNPASVAPAGTHALADVLAGLGRRVTPETTAQSAIAAAVAGTTLVITSPQDLTKASLTALGRVPANVVLVEPDTDSLARLAPQVALAGPLRAVLLTRPDCALRAAVLAGTAEMGGANLLVRSPPAGARQCYPSASGPTLVQLRGRGRLITVLGTAAPLMNSYLARDGDAALAINLLPTRRIVWLVPPLAPAATAGPAGPKSFFGLVPLAAYLVAAQLALALVLAIGWRSRRLGPLVPEPLPVVVHAAETVVGHGRLYQARRARGRAAGALRGAVVARLSAAIRLPAGTSDAAVSAAISGRSASGPARIFELLYGPAPRTDADLVALARDLDALEREVGVP
jgi:hypothetical protein